ncbi:DUF397 domain-containing protein [Actinoplanes sp. NPDC051859]|uniref:DUF397 domain-containing protein n=1 Tax=Actinoplanes sp. NPDC051859 TaxID=3363909 RepID=UPI0037AE3789
MTNRRYTKSTKSGGSGGNCVEWSIQNNGVYVRDSKNPDGPELLMSHQEWGTFTQAAGSGGAHRWIQPGCAGTAVAKDDHMLTFTPAEWEAFTAAVHAGECTIQLVSIG